jgi:RNA polymerase-binding transcription factor DksA
MVAPPGSLASRGVDERYESELARAGAVLDSVDEALTRLSGGGYGSCTTCGSPILATALEQDPTLARCEQHLPLSL